MTWTKQLPEKPGYYWYRRNGGHNLVLVFSNDGEMYVSIGNRYVPLTEFIQQDTSIEWAGPIPMPEEAQ